MRKWDYKNSTFEVLEAFNIENPDPNNTRDLSTGFYVVYYKGKTFLLDASQNIADKRKYCLLQENSNFRFYVPKEQVVGIKRTEHEQ